MTKRKPPQQLVVKFTFGDGTQYRQPLSELFITQIEQAAAMRLQARQLRERAAQLELIALGDDMAEADRLDGAANAIRARLQPQLQYALELAQREQQRINSVARASAASGAPQLEVFEQAAAAVTAAGLALTVRNLLDHWPPGQAELSESRIRQLLRARSGNP